MKEHKDSSPTFDLARSCTMVSVSASSKSNSAAGSAAQTKPTGRRWWLAPLLLFVAVGVPCTLFFLAAARDTPFSRDVLRHGAIGISVEPPKNDAINDTGPEISAPALLEELENEDVRLERVLKEAAMANNTVIVTTSNAAWAAPGSIMDLFLESFRIGNGTRELLKHLVIVALDPKAYMRCKAVHSHCFSLVTEGVDFSEEKYFMTQGYLQLVWRKLDILRMILAKGYNFVFSDADVMWFRNPFPHFYPDIDFQSSCDIFVNDPTSLRNRPNTGFKYVKANSRTVLFYEFWYSSRLKLPGKAQQGVFNSIKFHRYVRRLGVTFRFWSLDYFGGLCQPSKDLSKVITMHTNCCYGLKNKTHDIKVLLDDWRKYVSLPSMKKGSYQYSWSELQLECS